MGQAKQRKATDPNYGKVKQFGMVFTPSSLVDEMLNKLPPDSFTDPTKRFCDPACGNGNFLVEVVRRKLAAGHNAVQVAATTFGCEIQPDVAQECRDRLYKIFDEACKSVLDVANLFLIKYLIDNCIVTADALTFDWNSIGSNDKELQILLHHVNQEIIPLDMWVAFPVPNVKESDFNKIWERKFGVC